MGVQRRNRHNRRMRNQISGLEGERGRFCDRGSTVGGVRAGRVGREGWWARRRSPTVREGAMSRLASGGVVVLAYEPVEDPGAADLVDGDGLG